MSTQNELYDAAKALMPALRMVPTDPKLYTSFAVAGDAFGTYHLLSHYSEHSLLYVKVSIDGNHVAIDLCFKRHVDDLYFYGCTHMGELFMSPSPASLDFDWYRNHLYTLFKGFVEAAPNAHWQLPDVFRPQSVGQNNGPVVVRLAQSIRHRKSDRAPNPAVPSTRYSF